MVSVGESLLFHSTGSEALLLVLQGKNIPYIKVMPGYFTSLELFAQALQLITHRHIQWAHMGVCNGQTDFALTLTIWPENESYGCHTFVLFVS